MIQETFELKQVRQRARTLAQTQHSQMSDQELLAFEEQYVQIYLAEKEAKKEQKRKSRPSSAASSTHKSANKINRAQQNTNTVSEEKDDVGPIYNKGTKMLYRERLHEFFSQKLKPTISPGLLTSVKK